MYVYLYTGIPCYIFISLHVYKIIKRLYFRHSLIIVSILVVNVNQ